MKIVQIQGLYKNFGEKVALTNLNLEVEEGEIYGLLGPNGAGKSTTLHIICGLLRQDRGNVRVFGKETCKQMKAIKAHLGLVPQELGLFEELTAYENISFFVSLYGIKGKKLEEKTLKALEFVGLEGKRRDKVKSFSGGMKRRLNIACAIAHEPRLIIMDEPTVGVDPQSRKHILEAIKFLNKEGATIIYTTHYMEEAEALCDRIAIMDKGLCIAEGSQENLKSIINDKNSFCIQVAYIEKVEEAILKNIKGVESIQFKEDSIHIVSKKEISCLDPILSYLAQRECVIMGVNTQVTNLENVFLELTGRKLRD
ncbi:export ABC transporter ATP-binding protein [Sporanaerobium hydrogeniformans]|uniref:Export ABC transporter ATP-binding protein n=1 Tax=Sporanaerobium hydrogeniformans TaxID=3072179 RepID=A0AC61D9P9_9FIRM|nr:ABC transporter ATP-binding protein [Sporanaerobium hydrogeniformans]PHV70021.1 export ABC transporter ATP-binding protein [Sporanaerobium hydrogeniformans]